MRRFAPIFFGFISLTLAKSYRVDGIVVAVDLNQSTITVSHRPIAKLMPAMTMPFRVDDASVLKGLHPGSRVRFDLIVEGGQSTVRRLQAGGEADRTIPVPRNRAVVGQTLPGFDLLDERSRPVRLADFLGKVVAVNFLYTRCPLPDVCPRLAANFAYLQRRFRQRLGKDLVLLSITIDPQFDTPAVLRDYARRWGAVPDGWHFLTGGEAEIQRVAGSFGLVYWPDEGSIGHNSSTSIVSREGVLAATVEGSSFRVDQLGDVIAKQLEVSK